MGHLQIERLTEQDIPGAIECIQVAFEDDPYFHWAFNDLTKFNKARNKCSLTARCLWGINNALFYVAKEVSGPPSAPISRIIGVSCWLVPHPPSVPESWYTRYQNWLLSLRQLLNNIRFLGHGGLNTRRYWIWKARQSEAQQEVWTDPQGYYFCNIIAVRPDAQGKGVGRKLFEVVTQRADEEGVPCYLESSKWVPNVQIYRKMGFELVREIDCEDQGDACKVFCMIREPKQKI
ncbi:Acyl-CoA N-acyltransferase [Elaphomyces granulatus]|jgi:GNAT superfamily N-acetyltransferase